MCGICGAVQFDDASRADRAVRDMMAALHHRGPDDEGLLQVRSASFGMRRLSIIDLSSGHQPIFNEDCSLAVICNGEIYNFRELRRELEAQGHIFRTNSDTEVIVHAYENWEKDCVHHLRGMFAFAVVELPGRSSAAGKLFLARDRLGIKPLYYAVVDGLFLFASEVRALLATGLLPRQLSQPAVESYLLFGSTVEPMTLVDGIYSLLPGHRLMLALDAHAPTPRSEPYWEMRAAPRASKSAPSAPSSAQQVRQLLEESIRSHLIADVPVGVFLSSGLDSTVLAALASRQQSGIHSFTVIFPEQHYSEAALARKTAQRFATRHQELLLTGEEMLARQDEAVAALDQPSMDGINTYFVSWAARQAGLKVALSGLGSDEIFGGYSTFRTVAKASAVAAAANHSPAAARRLLTRAFAPVSAMSRGALADPARKLAALYREPRALPHPYFFARSLFVPQQVSRLMPGSNGARRESPWWNWLEETARRAETFDEFGAVTCLETRSYLVNTLLRDTDSMSMAHSLEVRVPFLDHPLVEFVANLPEAEKRGKNNKSLLVAALGGLLPEEIVRQRKRTFTLPWQKWLRGPLQQPVAASLSNLHPRLQSLLDANAVRALWRGFLAGHTSWSRVWSLCVLNRWVAAHLS